jgi:CDP-glycerol glycerophosphotransferase (TagB/SpsB family)
MRKFASRFFALLESDARKAGTTSRQHRLTQLESPLILYRPTFNHRSYATSAGEMYRYVTAFKQNGPKTRLESLVQHILHFL